MPLKELRHPHQITDWLQQWGRQLSQPASMILIGSAALLWHLARIGRDDPLPENGMDVDSVTESDAVAELAYDALIGSDFERTHGWHVISCLGWCWITCPQRGGCGRFQRLTVNSQCKCLLCRICWCPSGCAMNRGINSMKPLPGPWDFYEHRLTTLATARS
ncbi:MAG: hypothetical protein JWO89_3343 [Verrucomicrobiaceae bacterium]|nr:hypothetical protein [Verrucomicrobiaceae bacterium]